MQRTHDLWQRVISFENLYRAAYRVLRGKRGKVHAGDFFLNLETNLFRLQREIRGHTYRPGTYHTFWITEPKPRMISAAPFRDRVVHHALVNVIEPIFERRFIHHSYACRTGKGTHRALQQFVAWARSSRYVLKMDIHKFFPTLDHAILKERIRRTIKDSDVLWLCDLIIDRSNEQEVVMQHFPGDDLFTPLARRRGLPIGNLTSQFFANVYLDALDHVVKERLRVKRYLRYADDFCCFADDKKKLSDLRAAIVEALLGLRLRLNEGKSRVRQVKEGIEFLGFVVTPDRLRLNQTAVRRQRRRLKRLQRDYASGLLSWREVVMSLQAWNAHAKFGTTWKLRAHVFDQAPFIRSRGG
ncbi:MAG: reverse transcriptase domain-containing protein [Candidatus Binatia bacterium]